MTRIFITGNAGSGKTTLAKSLGPLLGIPFHSIDHIRWRSGWRTTPGEERLRRKREMMATPHWIIEGFAEDVQAAAEEIIFLDVSRRTAFTRALRRNLRHLFRPRPGLPPGCIEIRRLHLLPEFVLRFHRTRRRVLLRQLADPAHRQTIHHVRSPAELEALVGALLQRKSLPIS